MKADMLRKEDRDKCWSARDNYWNCVTELLKKPENRELREKELRNRCIGEREAYEAICPAVWIELFDKKKEFELFKQQKFEQELKDSLVGRSN
ncbi:unnamed protein product [Dicrocoelium dendriticum]|nr:unnamed protein product [Dicrocoelium dendriticum]